MQRLLDNLLKVSPQITVDHPDRKYFIGEVGTVTYSLTNNTTQPVEIPDPTDDLSGDIYLNDHSAACTAEELSGEQFQKCKPRLDHGPARPTATLRSRTLAPGETVSIVVRTTDPAVPGSSLTKIGGDGSFADRDGEWEITHHLGGSLVIHSVAPQLKKSAWAALHATEDGLPKQVPVFVVLDDAQHSVCISEEYGFDPQEKIEVDANGKLTWQGVRVVSPFHRVATIPRAAETLTATADEHDWITIQADLGQGLIYRFVLDGNRNLAQTTIQNP